MKTLAYLILLLSLCKIQHLGAQEIQISTPSIVSEGMPEKVSEEQIAILKLYSKDIKTDISDALVEVQNLRGQEAFEFLKSKTINISSTYNERSNVFVRYALNRSLVLSNLLDREDQSVGNSKVDTKIRLIKQSLKIALFYTEFDFERFNEFDFSTYARFGTDYYSLMVELSKSIFDASAQYNFLKVALEFFQWDLYRELSNKSYSATIVKINRFLGTLPREEMSDERLVANIRIIRKFISTLKVRIYQSTIEVNEIQQRIDQAIELNKGININENFKKDEILIYYMVGFSLDNMQGQPVRYVSKDNINIDNIVQNEKNKKAKELYRVSDLDLFKTKGCLLDKEYCIGEPVIDLFGTPVTIIGLSYWTGMLLVADKNGVISHGYKGGFYRRTGCREKMNLCVGDKVVSAWNSKEIKIVTGIGTADRYSMFMVGDSIYDDKHAVTSVTGWSKL